MIATRWRNGQAFEGMTRLVCAAFAGITSGFIAGGIIVALRGTHWGLNAYSGDGGDLIRWANGQWMFPSYAVGAESAALVLGASRHPGRVCTQATLQVYGTALVIGPATYVQWRMIVRAPWALGIGLVAALPADRVVPQSRSAIRWPTSWWRASSRRHGTSPT